MAYTPPDKASIRQARTYPMALAILRLVGARNGYAIALHGSQQRDLDVVALPWTENATSAEEFVADMQHMFAQYELMAFISPEDKDRFPERKPHGRQCWAFHFGGGPYLDLAVMPTWPCAANPVHEEEPKI